MVNNNMIFERGKLYFLSHLHDGELSAPGRIAAAIFLSHLHDGERGGGDFL